MNDSELKIDESRQERIPSLGERCKNAIIGGGLGFMLLYIISFWMFPGLGFGAFQMVSHPIVDSISGVIKTYIIAFVAICALNGWFSGKNFFHRLKTYIEYWNVW